MKCNIFCFLFPCSESEASGSARVTPVQQRRRQVPSKHPHRRGRKVSAPPELQPHLGPHPGHLNNKKIPGGAITDTAPNSSSNSPQEYIININSGNNGEDDFLIADEMLRCFDLTSLLI